MMTHTPKKSLGQNFLRDDAVIAQIVDAAQLDARSSVVEVGPGEGVLTAPLAAVAGTVIAVEVDSDLVPQLRRRFAVRRNVHIEHADIRRVYLKELLGKYGVKQYCVVANLPYYITSSIVRFFMESRTPPTHLVIMVQKEVAERIIASPGRMSILAVAVQYYGDVSWVCDVPRESFAPVPNVDSAVIKITHHGVVATPAQDKAFFRIVRAGFSARRKMLVNNLASSFHREKEDIRALLAQCGLSETVRPQDLSVDDWRALTKIFRR